MKFKGWIPVASGFLSFTNIRGQIITGRCSEAPKFLEGSFDTPGNLCVISSTRALIDRPFGASVGNEKFEFECHATRHVRQQLTISRSTPLSSHSRGIPSIQHLQEEALEGYVIAYPNALKDEAEGLNRNNINPGVHEYYACWVLAFTLERNGVITLDWGDLPTGAISKIVDTGNTPEGEEAAIMMLTFETFSFLKDLIHNHKFHSIDDDSIVVPYKVADDADESWKDETARSIHRAIVSSLRNSPAQYELTNALGKSCYLRTFLAISGTTLSKTMLESLENLEKTIETRLTRKSFETSAWDAISSTAMTIIIALAATALTLVQLLQLPCIEGLSDDTACEKTFSLSKTAFDITEFLLTYWSYTAVTMSIAFFFFGYLACRRSILELYSVRTGSEGWDWHIMRFFYGLALTQGRYMAFFWLSVFALAMLGLFGFWLYSILKFPLFPS